MVVIKEEKGKTMTGLLREGQSIKLPLKLKGFKGTSVQKNTESFHVCSLCLQYLGSLTQIQENCTGDHKAALWPQRFAARVAQRQNGKGGGKNEIVLIRLKSWKVIFLFLLAF